MATKVKKPNFFLVGAPKCGTTAMNEYLSRHPDIYIPDQKELHYFCSDLKSRNFRHDLDRYMENFSGWEDECIGGESSVWYLYSKNAAREIKEFSPHARILVMLRNPIDMIYSNYFQFRYSGNEVLPTFEEAIYAEVDRKSGINIPENAIFPEGLFYIETAKYADQVRRYIDIFGRDRMHIIIFDDFIHDTAACYKKTLQFLGVDDAFTCNFEVINSNKRVHSRFVSDLLGSDSVLQRAGKKLLPKSVSVKKYLRKLSRKVRSINTKYETRPPMSDEIRGYLQSSLTQDIQTLSELIDRDLSEWCGIKDR